MARSSIPDLTNRVKVSISKSIQGLTTAIGAKNASHYVQMLRDMFKHVTASDRLSTLALSRIVTSRLPEKTIFVNISGTATLRYL